MESAISQILGAATNVTNSTLARRAHDAEFAGQRADPSEIATNIGLIITVAIVFSALGVLCVLDKRKRTRITDSYKSMGQLV
ncbi:hypothetical protein FS837_005600 [Tulasnella sp. UAMH 9824]|nr:hypothetical protein FS837_005600 [Tulasnella sp. UAMH 9824]